MDLDEARERIDQLDAQIVQLLNERARIAQELAKRKQESGAAVYDPTRERAVHERVCELNAGPLSDANLVAIYREIISATRALEAPQRVAFLGPEATYTHQAARRHFGHATEYVPCRSIAEVFQETERGSASFGVIPIENTIEGAVTHTLDMLADSDLKLRICAEIMLEIHHNLLGHGPLAQVKRIYSHPQALAQSRRWLAQHLPNADLIETTSTVRGAELAATDPEAAAVGPELAASLYRLTILARSIEDSADNVTRFLVLGPEMARGSGDDKTAIMFSIRDRVGALHDALGLFRQQSINLTKIESRPSRRRAWDYVFFVDLEGHPDDPHVQAALRALAQECVDVRVLGAWPRGSQANGS
ncbi:MAG: prephenate dehydratase [Chloroflexi bacterium]|nr:prephenate dehydratase [Chloroflexota bacterium]MBI4505505.1 prephenate dehydratase [Chloroflexota bacterium]